MSARVAAAVSLVCALLSGCSGSNTKPTQITIQLASTGQQQDTVQVSGPTAFTATVTYSNAIATWSLTGPGTLSDQTGGRVVYRPPAQLGSATSAVLTAATVDASASVTLQLSTPAMPAVTLGAGVVTAPVQVTYDAQDIPHISCAQTADCLAVQGYLHARDRLFPMDLLRRVARGRVAELIGVAGLTQDVQLRTLFTTRDGRRIEDALVTYMQAVDPDSYAKLVAYSNGVNAYLHQVQQGTVALPGEYSQLPYPIVGSDLYDWTPQDTMALARLQQYQLSESLSEEQTFGQFAQAYLGTSPGKLSVWIRSAAPAGAQTHTLTGPVSHRPRAQAGSSPDLQVPDLSPWKGVLDLAFARLEEVRSAIHPLGESVGSNNWVVDAAHSANGHAMVANDPHLSLQYPPLFHLATMTSANAADNLDLAGGAFPGIPGALVGRGKNVGWGVTVVGYDVTDLYLEQLEACPAKYYQAPYNVPAGVTYCVVQTDPANPALTIPVATTWKVRVGPGPAVVDAKSIPALASLVPAGILVVPHHGPIIQAPDAQGKAVSVRWTGHETNTLDLKAFFGLATAKSVDDAFAALKFYATGAQNFVLADDQGNIGYDPHALVPVRHFANGGDPAFLPFSPPWFPLPGNGSAEWGSGVATDSCDGWDHSHAPGLIPKTPAAACWVSDDLLPHGKNPAWGFYATANADPLGTSDDNNPRAHPPYLSFDWDDSTGFRHARITQRLAGIIAAKGTISLDDMESIQSDHVSLLGGFYAGYLKALPDQVVNAIPATKRPDFLAARALLSSWSLDCPSGLVGTNPSLSPADPTPAVYTDSSACLLFHTFLRTLNNSVFNDDLAVAGLSQQGVQETKAMIYMLTPGSGADQSFCDDVDASGKSLSTGGPRSCLDQVISALITSYDLLTAAKGPQPAGGWLWGRVHTMQPVSQLALVTTGYEPGPYARPGGAFTVDVGNPSAAKRGFDFSFGSSGNVRHISIMDPASPVVKMQLPGPERDVPAGQLSGRDLLGDWVSNRYFDFAFSGQIAQATVATQSFKAQ